MKISKILYVSAVLLSLFNLNCSEDPSKNPTENEVFKENIRKASVEPGSMSGFQDKSRKVALELASDDCDQALTRKLYRTFDTEGAMNDSSEENEDPTENEVFKENIKKAFVEPGSMSGFQDKSRKVMLELASDDYDQALARKLFKMFDTEGAMNGFSEENKANMVSHAGIVAKEATRYRQMALLEAFDHGGDFNSVSEDTKMQLFYLTIHE